MREILKSAIEHYGKDMQQYVAIEEMSELQKEICKFQRGIGNKLHLAEEIADVEIMVEQLKMIYKCDQMVEIYKIKKVERLETRLDHDKKHLEKCIEREGEE